VSNIDASDAWKIYEAWLKQSLFQDRLPVLAGLYDLNSEFDVIESAGLFLNSSHGIGADYSQTGSHS
jgi:porin